MGRNLAALTCVILSLVLIIVPCAYIFYTFINEVANLYGRLTSGGHDIRETLEKLREVAPGGSPATATAPRSSPRNFPSWRSRSAGWWRATPWPWAAVR